MTQGYSDLGCVSELNKAFIKSCFLDLGFIFFPVLCSSRVMRSRTFFFLRTLTVIGCGVGVADRIEVEILATFFAAFCLPPSIQYKLSLFSYGCLALSSSLSSSCLFSTSSRFVAASHLLILRWK